jgi:transposase-like protein
VDSTGQTIDFLITADAAAAKRFFGKALSSPGNLVPRVINVDKDPAFPAAVEALKEEGILPRRVRLRQMQIPQQCSGTGPSHGQQADLAGERVWLVLHRMADVARS